MESRNTVDLHRTHCSMNKAVSDWLNTLAYPAQVLFEMKEPQTPTAEPTEATNWMATSLTAIVTQSQTSPLIANTSHLSPVPSSIGGDSCFYDGDPSEIASQIASGKHALTSDIDWQRSSGYQSTTSCHYKNSDDRLTRDEDDDDHNVPLQLSKSNQLVRSSFESLFAPTSNGNVVESGNDDHTWLAAPSSNLSSKVIKRPERKPRSSSMSSWERDQMYNDLARAVDSSYPFAEEEELVFYGRLAVPQQYQRLNSLTHNQETQQNLLPTLNESAPPPTSIDQPSLFSSIRSSLPFETPALSMPVRVPVTSTPMANSPTEATSDVCIAVLNEQLWRLQSQMGRLSPPSLLSVGSSSSTGYSSEDLPPPSSNAGRWPKSTLKQARPVLGRPRLGDINTRCSNNSAGSNQTNRYDEHSSNGSVMSQSSNGMFTKNHRNNSVSNNMLDRGFSDKENINVFRM